MTAGPPVPAPSAPTAAPKKRGATGYLAASGVAQVCALARYTVLARILGPEQLGLAATLILTSQFFEAISDSGSDRFLIQDRDGDTPAVQKFVQLVFLVRGTLMALGLLVFAQPIAAFCKTPALAPGLMGLAISPLIFGFLHLDMRRAQRHHDFRSEGLGLMVGESLGLLVTIIAACLRPDFTATIYGLVARSLSMVAVSHWRAHRPYQVGFSREHASRLTHFAAPLMLNGLLLFLGSQGDRLVVGSRLGLAALGHYSAVLLLIFYPSAMIMRYQAAIHLPRIAAERDRSTHREVAADALAGQTLVLGLLMMAGFALVAPTMVVVLYGGKFAQSQLVICLIGILQTGRFVRLWPNTVALAMGRSGIVLANNIARLIGLPCAIGGAMTVGGLVGITAGLIGGEMVALVSAILLINLADGEPAWRNFDRIALFLLSGTLVLGLTFTFMHPTLIRLLSLSLATVGLVAWVGLRERATISTAAAMVRARLERLRSRAPTGAVRAGTGRD
jgi:O-antigen/teichoic acid export membrane protein